MGSADLLGVMSLTATLLGVLGAFTANRSLRQAGRAALFSGLSIFGLTSMFTALTLSDELSSLIVAFLTVLAAVIAAGWFTRRFYLDFGPAPVQDAHPLDID